MILPARFLGTEATNAISPGATAAPSRFRAKPSSSIRSAVDAEKPGLSAHERLHHLAGHGIGLADTPPPRGSHPRGDHANVVGTSPPGSPDSDRAGRRRVPAIPLSPVPVDGDPRQGAAQVVRHVAQHPAPGRARRRSARPGGWSARSRPGCARGPPAEPPGSSRGAACASAAGAARRWRSREGAGRGAARAGAVLRCGARAPPGGARRCRRADSAPGAYAASRASPGRQR